MRFLPLASPGDGKLQAMPAVNGQRSKMWWNNMQAGHSGRTAQQISQHQLCRCSSQKWLVQQRVRRLRRPSRCRRMPLHAGLRLDNRELVVGDCLSLTAFSLYKQIAALILMPSFPGWLAPMHFNPLRFAEFLSFTLTLCGTWVGASALCRGYLYNATSDLQTAISRVTLAWLVSQPVAAAQLVLVTAAEGHTLVGEGGFGHVLPLAASGPGEPFVTAAGVLGLMACWRTWYCVRLDVWNIRSMAGSRLDRMSDMAHFTEALRSSIFLSIAFCVCLSYLSHQVGEEDLEAFLQAALQRLPHP